MKNNLNEIGLVEMNSNELNQIDGGHLTPPLAALATAAMVAVAFNDAYNSTVTELVKEAQK